MKAFVRTELQPLLDALREQGVDNAHVELIKAVYTDQARAVAGSHLISISRRVRQGDVLSRLLFKVALGLAFQR